MSGAKSRERQGGPRPQKVRGPAHRDRERSRFGGKDQELRSKDVRSATPPRPQGDTLSEQGNPSELGPRGLEDLSDWQMVFKATHPAATH